MGVKKIEENDEVPEAAGFHSGMQGAGRAASCRGFRLPYVAGSVAESAGGEVKSVNLHQKDMPLKTENEPFRGDFLQGKPCGKILSLPHDAAVHACQAGRRV